MKDTQFKRMLFILEEFNDRKDGILDGYDEVLQHEFDLSPKQIDRLLQKISNEMDNIQPIKIGRKKAYKLIKPIDLFVETFKNANEINWLFNMAHDADPEIFKELEEYTNKTKHVFQFKNTPFEDIKSLEEKEVFKRLKSAVEHREYRKIKFKGRDEAQDNLKCLKLIFMDGNWYIAYIEDEQLRFGRISFIEKVEYASNIGSFQPSGIKKQMDFLQTVQNSMTRYDKPTKIARLQAKPFIAKYFDEDMKKFMLSQKFEKKLDDGSIIFTVEYTQAIEILPFIQGWLPNLLILEPKDLKEQYLKRLTQTINNY